MLMLHARPLCTYVKFTGVDPGLRHTMPTSVRRPVATVFPFAQDFSLQRALLVLSKRRS